MVGLLLSLRKKKIWRKNCLRNSCFESLPKVIFEDETKIIFSDLVILCFQRKMQPFKSAMTAYNGVVITYKVATRCQVKDAASHKRPGLVPPIVLPGWLPEKCAGGQLSTTVPYHATELLFCGKMIQCCPPLYGLRKSPYTLPTKSTSGGSSMAVHLVVPSQSNRSYVVLRYIGNSVKGH